MKILVKIRALYEIARIEKAIILMMLKIDVARKVFTENPETAPRFFILLRKIMSVCHL